MDTIETILHYALIIGEVAIALGLVIFVHELGHFVVAKLCGVKCEKFYLGFDVYGLKLFKYQWGETEYGIGALPLGGYVKMLGQDDNPARAYEEMQRAKLAAPGQETAGESAGAAPVGSSSGGDEEPVVLDPRSYLAQSVPKRMAIISAGVVMNLIFAFIFAVLAYSLGVKDSPCQISGVVPGQPAWRAGLQPGDRIIRIGDAPTPYFSDLSQAILLGDYADGLKLEIDRPGVGELTATIMPDNKLLKLPSIGVRGPATTSLQEIDRWKESVPVLADSAAAAAKPAFAAGDEIVAIQDAPISDYADVARELARHSNQPLRVQVRRQVASTEGDKKTPPREELLTIEVPVAPLRELGLAMTPGPISAIQAGSPADGKLQVGDEIEAIDDQPPGDPMTLPSRLDARSGETVVVRVRRDGQSEPLDVTLELRPPLDSDWPGLLVPGVPMSVPSLGIAYPVFSRVAAVTPGGPADAMLIRAGDEIVAAEVAAPRATGFWSFQEPESQPFKFDGASPNWPVFMGLLQSMPDDSTIKLTVARKGEQDREVAINPIASSDWFDADRGMLFAPMLVTHQAASVGDALSLGFDKTKDNVLMVYRFLRKLTERQVPASAIGGPIGIAKMAGAQAYEGLPQLLMFLVMLSANLAVINFLPIPLLDGGHMVFLVIEAIRRKPVSERVVVAFHYAGFVFLITLMGFVFFLDLGGRTWLWKS